MTTLFALAVALVRGWTRLYTVGLGADHRRARRAEIESDLWEFQRDAIATGRGALNPAGHVFLRLMLGIPDDLRWRAAQAWPGSARSRQVIAVATATTLVVVALYAWTGGRQLEWPRLPVAPDLTWKPVASPGPPPPPPPPPCFPRYVVDKCR